MSEDEEQAALRRAAADAAGRFGLIVDSLRMRRRGRDHVLQVVVDRAEGTEPVDLDAVAEVSRALSARLDVLDPIPGGYALEVSSPGAERPLTRPRHYRRQVGREVRVELRSGQILRGRLESVGERGFALSGERGTTSVSFDNVKRARPCVMFGSEE